MCLRNPVLMIYSVPEHIRILQGWVMRGQQAANISPRWQKAVVRVCFCHSSQTNWGKTECSSLSHTNTHIHKHT